MSLQHILLGFINYQPATGYEIKAAFEQSVYFFWNATLPQIYRTLNQMEEKKWLAVTVEHQDGKPSRKVYRITELGKKEFLKWLAEPPEVSPPRSPMLVKVFFGNQMDRNDMAGLLIKCRRDHEEQLEKYKKEILPVMEHYTKLAGAPEDARYWALTLDFGLRYAEMVSEWCNAAIKSLEINEGKEG